MEGDEGDGDEDQPQTKKDFNAWRSTFKNTVHTCVELYDDRLGSNVKGSNRNWKWDSLELVFNLNSRCHQNVELLAACSVNEIWWLNLWLTSGVWSNMSTLIVSLSGICSSVSTCWRLPTSMCLVNSTSSWKFNDRVRTSRVVDH